MQVLEFLYSAAVVVSITASVPQLRQLIITKASDEFSLLSWGVWLGTQLVSLAYVISIKNTLLIGANLLWASFYLAMVYLIIHYRHIHKPVLVVAVDDSQPV